MIPSPTSDLSICAEENAILVTGATSGIGLAFALRAAEQGFNVALCGRNVERLAQTAEIIRQGGGQALAIEMDVSKECDVISAFDRAESAFGPIDRVVASAGINYSGAATDISADDIDSIFAVNVKGMLFTAREAARRMIKRSPPAAGVRKIILVGSASGLRDGMNAMPKLSTYSASKAAIDMLAKSLAREWLRRAINVNVVHPGVTRTAMNSAWLDSEDGKLLLSTFGRKSALEVDQVTPLMCFLLSDAANAITGGSFLVDDGQIL